MKTLISLFDYTGNWSRPYKENGWKVIQVDIKLGVDILQFNFKKIKNVNGVLAAIPCTDYATSGAKHFAKKDEDGRTKLSQKLVKKTKDVIDYFSLFNLDFFSIENPRSRIHILNPWLGKPKLKFNPCDYAGFDPIPSNSNYYKETWLWGDFKIPKIKPRLPLSDNYPGWEKLGGKSEKTKTLRSITPLGFSYAFFEANS